MKRFLLTITLVALCLSAAAIDNKGISHTTLSPDRFPLIDSGVPVPVFVSGDDDTAVKIAAANLSLDFGRVCGTDAPLHMTGAEKPVSRAVIAGTIGTPLIDAMAKSGKLDLSQLNGKVEKYIMLTLTDPLPGFGEALVIAGSDRRGTVYGIYELSEQLGVSPWYDWADVPVHHADYLSLEKGVYTAGEPAVRYRGIFLNDEAPCLTTWVKNTYGTDFGGHEFYARVFELILRLRGNFMWPAMWGWAFYADDPENSAVADRMGVIMGTSHHEPMARNHQEYARDREGWGEWNYETNRKSLDRFFREGMERALHTEDLITIGMRGDGDTALGANEGHDDEFVPNDLATIKVLEGVVKNQRRIISKVTGKPAEQRPQVWALYKEVQRYYDKGLKVPDDAIILLSDDNWGDIRRLPGEKDRNHPGGFGMYYHVDYVGAPRNSKWLNITPVQHMWDQLSLTWQYGVDKLWVLNVGDLKPMEYPIDLFMDMAWNPEAWNAGNLLDHTRGFCSDAFGEDQADEAARILNLYSKYAGRVTAEMLDARTYNLENGEWKKVADEFMRLEAEALRQYMTLSPDCRDAYKQVILFPVQALANVYDMYYSQAMNLKLFAEGNPECNAWADKVESCFRRDAALCRDYNEVMSGGKWNGMMIQKHIGYRGWNDDFPADTMPRVKRMEECPEGGYTFKPGDGVVVMEAPHFFVADDSSDAEWTVIPDMGRTLGGVALMPYDRSVDGGRISYRMELPKDVRDVRVHVIVSSTLAFKRSEGHRYTVGFEGGDSVEVNFNGDLNEEPENVYRIYYPTVAGRVIDKVSDLSVPVGDGAKTLVLRPLDPGVVFEKIVVDWGGYQKSFLFMDESSCSR